MHRVRNLLVIITVLALMLGIPRLTYAQETLTIYADYPSMVVGIGEGITLDVTIQVPESGVVTLDVNNLPEGWSAEYRGGGRGIRAIYVQKDEPARVQLRLTQPQNVTAGTYRFNLVARAGEVTATFPMELIVQEKTPARLTLQTDFPVLRGGSESTFSFNATLKNEGGEDIFVTLSADAPREFKVTFRATGKDITNLPTEIKANASQRIDISVEPLTSVPVGSYPITVRAQSETAEATLTLTAEVFGQPQLTLTTPDERLSADAYLGKTTPIKLVLRNTGNSPALGVRLSASSPSGWEVTFEPQEVVEVPANGEVEVTVNIKPAERAVAGDYIITFRAQPKDGASKSADFRITMRTSTLWGMVGVILIAVALAIVGLAVVRFGRR